MSSDVSGLEENRPLGGGGKKHIKNRISKDVTKEIIHHHRARQDLAKEKIKMRI